MYAYHYTPCPCYRLHVLNLFLLCNCNYVSLTCIFLFSATATSGKCHLLLISDMTSIFKISHIPEIILCLFLAYFTYYNVRYVHAFCGTGCFCIHLYINIFHAVFSLFIHLPLSDYIYISVHKSLICQSIYQFRFLIVIYSAALVVKQYFKYTKFHSL